MAKPFPELRERLLRAGIAPRHVRRYLAELSDHLADLTADEQRSGRSLPQAQSAALLRLGTIDQLTNAMTSQRQLQAWCVRAPWAAFGLAPLLTLAAVWLIALFFLWTGWQLFLPGADSPFVRTAGPIYRLENLYFQFDRALYFGAPILVGWAIGLVAARQRLQPLWPTIGLILIALFGGTPQVHASRTAVPHGLGHISVHLALGAPMPLTPFTILHLMVILAFAPLPWLLWWLRKSDSLPAPLR